MKMASANTPKKFLCQQFSLPHNSVVSGSHCHVWISTGGSYTLCIFYFSFTSIRTLCVNQLVHRIRAVRGLTLTRSRMHFWERTNSLFRKNAYSNPYSCGETYGKQLSIVQCLETWTLTHLSINCPVNGSWHVKMSAELLILLTIYGEKLFWVAVSAPLTSKR